MVSRFKSDPVGLAALGKYVAHQREKVAEAIADDARRYAPVDSGEMVSTIHTEHFDVSSRVYVGSDHWRDVEYGTKPHVIRAVTKKVLSNNGEAEIFGPVVHHPGTRQQPFMRRALYQRRVLRRY